MTQKINLRTIMLAAATLAFGVAVHAQNNNTSVPVPSTDSGKGLLGQTYAGLAYSYTDVVNTPTNDQGLRFEYNQPLNTGFDFKLTYDGLRSERYANTRNTWQMADASAIAFIPDYAWGRPFIGVGAGWIWTKTLGSHDSSFEYNVGTGVEFQVTRALSLTPYVTYTAADVLASNHMWTYGVRSNYWLTSQWGVAAGVGRDNSRDTSYSAGVNYRF